jgi:hypothetical protein
MSQTENLFLTPMLVHGGLLKDVVDQTGFSFNDAYFYLCFPSTGSYSYVRPKVMLSCPPTFAFCAPNLLCICFHPQTAQAA